MKKIIAALAVIVSLSGLAQSAVVFADAPSVTNTTPASYIFNGWYTYFQLDWHATCPGGPTIDYNFRSDLLHLPDGSHTYRFYQGNEDQSQWYTIDNGSYQYANICPVAGVATYSLINTLTLPLDTTNPTLSITSPSDGQHISATSVNVTGTASDSGSGIDFVDVNGYSAYRNGDNWNAPIYFHTGFSGNLPITVKTYDFTGHYVSKSLTIYVDPPTTAISGNKPVGSSSKPGASTGQVQSQNPGSSAAASTKKSNSMKSVNGTSANADGVSSNDKFIVGGLAGLALLSAAAFKFNLFGMLARLLSLGH